MLDGHIPIHNMPYSSEDHQRACSENGRPSKVVAAAVLQDDHIWTGRRHCEIINVVYATTGKRVMQDQQGFWSDNGIWLTRKAAEQVCWENGQIPKDFDKRTLLSEHLW